MTDPATGTDLERLHESLAGLQKSTKRTLPVFIIGILATLLAAGIALYYILTLSAELNDARIELRQTQAALTDARQKLKRTEQTLKEVRDSAGAPGNAARIDAAIASVSASQKELAAASSSLTQATTRLPAPSPANRAADLSGAWTDEYGTVYQLSQSGSRFGYRASFRNAGAKNASTTGIATGTAKGNELRYSYQDSLGNRYQCTATVSSDAQRIEEVCKPPKGQPLRVTLIRS